MLIKMLYYFEMITISLIFCMNVSMGFFLIILQPLSFAYFKRRRSITNSCYKNEAIFKERLQVCKVVIIF